MNELFLGFAHSMKIVNYQLCISYLNMVLRSKGKLFLTDPFALARKSGSNLGLNGIIWDICGRELIFDYLIQKNERSRQKKLFIL